MTDAPLTLEEAAAHFRVSRRFFQDFIASHPFYRVLGRRKLFFSDDIHRLTEALKDHERQPKCVTDPRPTFLYFVEAGGYIKIGIAGRWKKRLSGLQSSCPLPIKRLLVIRATRGMESDIHEKFKEFCTRGEWFRDVPEIRKFIARALASELVVASEQ